MDRWTVGPVQVRVLFGILFAASFMFTRIGAFCANHAVQVPLVNWINDRSLYPQDPFMAALARYPSGLWPAVALLARVFPLEGMLLILYVFERLFVLYAAGRLARAFAPRSQLAVAAAVALFAFPIDSMVGYGTIVEGYLEQTGLAIPCFLLAAAAFHERRRVAWAVWLAGGFNLTSMYGTFALTYFGAVFAFDAEYRSEWKRWVQSFLFFLVLASYGLSMSISAARGPSPDEALWFSAARERGWSHFYPLTWGWEPFARFGALLAVFAIVLAFIRREQPRLFRHGALWMAVACLWLLEAFVAPYVLKSRRLMMMQPARGTDLFVCFAGIAMVCVASTRLEQASASNGRRWWIIALGASFLACGVPGTWVVGAGLVVAAAPPVWRILARLASPRRLAWLLAAWVVIAGLEAEDVRSSEPGDWQVLVFRGPDASVRELAAWAQEHTPVDAVFLVNPGMRPNFNQFMGMAKRSIFSSSEEGTALYWAPDFVPDWIGRLGALGVDIAEEHHARLNYALDLAFQDLEDDDVADLKQSYRLDYWIIPSGQSSRFPVVLTTDKYQVLELR